MVAPGHRMAGREEVAIKELGRENFVAHHVASPQRLKVVQAFKRHKTPLQMGIELPTIEAIKRFVEMGNGVAWCRG